MNEWIQWRNAFYRIPWLGSTLSQLKSLQWPETYSFLRFTALLHKTHMRVRAHTHAHYRKPGRTPTAGLSQVRSLAIWDHESTPSFIWESLSALLGCPLSKTSSILSTIQRPTGCPSYLSPPPLANGQLNPQSPEGNTVCWVWSRRTRPSKKITSSGPPLTNVRLLGQPQPALMPLSHKPCGCWQCPAAQPGRPPHSWLRSC